MNKETKERRLMLGNTVYHNYFLSLLLFGIFLITHIHKRVNSSWCGINKDIWFIVQGSPGFGIPGQRGPKGENGERVCHHLTLQPLLPSYNTEVQNSC